MKPDRLLNRRVVFKLHGMDPLDATILKQDETGYWIRGGTLAGQLDQTNCSLRRAMCATLSSAASSGSALQGNGSEDFIVRLSGILISVDLADISGQGMTLLRLPSTACCTPLQTPRGGVFWALSNSAGRAPLQFRTLRGRY